jgi:hypothetical protein
MKIGGYLSYAAIVAISAFLLIGCCPKPDTASQEERVFIKMVDKTAAKLDLDEDQKVQLERLKMDIRKHFQEGKGEKNKDLMKIKAEARKEDPEIHTMTSLLQGMLRDETERINQAFDLMLGFQNNLNEVQKERLAQMISDWVAKWD